LVDCVGGTLECGKPLWYEDDIQLTCMRTNKIAIFALGFLLVAGRTLANDTTARVGAGGIVPLKSSQIRMVSELLEVSTKSIRVKYIFLNEDSADVRTTVAFPMPSYGWTSGDSALEGNVGPLKTFKHLVNGVPVLTQIERKAVVSGRNITDQLRKIGLTDNQIFVTFGKCVSSNSSGVNCGLSKRQQAEIERLIGNGNDDPTWRVEETVFWDQVFPAGQPIEVRHEYAPFVGMSYTSPYQESPRYAGTSPADYLPRVTPLNRPVDSNEACLDDGIGQALRKKVGTIVEGGTSSVQVILNDVEYILGTGRNWKGPIQDFKLRIEKSSPDQIISLCFPGKPRRISPTVLEFSQSDYVPQDRLIVYFFTLMRP